MLVMKKMSVKKTAVYICIIILMLFSMFYVIYSNSKIGASAPAAAISSSQLVKTASTATDMTKIKNNGGFDLTIFSSTKYQELRENVIAPAGQPVTGKKDPFKSN
jgi:hypothetical protein